MLKLRSKTCHIGASINTRTQRAGEERIPYLDIPVTISITAKELASIVGDAHVPDAWFSTKDGKLDEPLLKGWAPYKPRFKFEHSLAVLTVGVNGEKIDCGDCTLNKFVFEPQSDGRTALKLKIQTEANIDRVKLILWLDTDQDVVLQFGELVGNDAQEDLPLEVDDADDEAPSRSVPRNDGAAALN